MAAPGDAPREALARCRVVMGHFTIADARHVPGPRRIFTVLREPRERLLSYHHFLARHRPEVVARPPTRMPRSPAACRSRSSSPIPTARAGRPAQRHDAQPGRRLCPGGGRNRYRQPWETDAQAISGPELLSRALATLFALDFYGFTDRLEQDRPRLMAALGLPDTGPLPRENTRDLVSDILEQRPPPKVTPLAERLIHRLTDLDRPALPSRAAGGSACDRVGPRRTRPCQHPRAPLDGVTILAVEQYGAGPFGSICWPISAPR